MKLYENVVIGNFLYGLGFAVCSRMESGAMPSMINLLQQTPADRALSDVLLEFPGFVRLIEFKERSNKSTKERARHTKLAAALGTDDQMKGISRDMHWFVETSPSEKTVVSRIVPYLDAFPSDHSTHSFTKFIEDTAQAAVVGATSYGPEEQRKYLNLVKFCQGAESVGTGGLLIAIDREGNLRYAQLADMLQLRLQDKEVVTQIQLALEKAQEVLEKSLERGCGRSLGR